MWEIEGGEGRQPPVPDRGSTLQRFFSPTAPTNQKKQSPFLHHPSQSKLRAKAPFSQYAALEARGAKVVFGDPAAPAAALPAGASFDVVLDNNGKDMDACQPLIDLFKVRSEEKSGLWVVCARPGFF